MRYLLGPVLQHVMADSAGHTSYVSNVLVPLAVALIGASAALFTGLAARKLNHRTDIRDQAARDLVLCQEQVEDLQADVLMLKRFVFGLRVRLADENIESPEMPQLRSERWGN